MEGRSRVHDARRLIGFTIVCLAVGAFLSPAAARNSGPDVSTAEAQVVSIALHSAESCADYGLFRWKAVKGVDSYTLKFNDAAYGGAEQIKVISKPFTEDVKEAPGSPLNAPAGTHQAGWTGIFGSPPCGEPVDYSGRLTNARVEYVREGSYIEGKIRVPGCEVGCPSVKGIKVTANGKTDRSDTTDANGNYSIKVRKGEYKVFPRKGGLDFNPDKRNVRVGEDDSARANFSIRYVPPDPLAVATVVEVKAEKGHVARAEYFRDGEWRPVKLDTVVRPGDRIRTDAFTVAAIEFAIGGRFGINKNSAIKVTGEGNAESPKSSVELTKGQMWAKCQKLKEPLEIETGGGGVMGIRG